MTEMNDYYRDRAPDYDAVFHYPERQQDLRYLESWVQSELEGRNVLEIAAGTGYWTQFMSRSAESIVATDVEEAQMKQITHRELLCPVELRSVDAYCLDQSLGQDFDAAFMGCWWSHVPRQRIAEFLDSLHRCLKPGALVLMLDNSKAQCVRLPISYTDQWGNTWQDRVLDNGESYRVLKNFPAEEEMIAVIEGGGRSAQFTELENFWMFQYTKGN